MSNLITNYNNLGFEPIHIQEALDQIKREIEASILNDGDNGKNNLIRTSKLINLVHNALKTQFLDGGIHPSLINPDLKYLIRNRNKNTVIDHLPDKELSIAGFLKAKKQDISILPNNISPQKEILHFPTYLNGFQDSLGSQLTERILSVNIRSQVSSVAKNFDTLYERTFAEALNLHLRFNNMVLGEVYMIIAQEYDSEACKRKEIIFKKSQHIEKYILAFQALNHRRNIDDPLYKYERVALLIVDFSREVPKLYQHTDELRRDGLISPSSCASLEGLTFKNFVGDLLEIYRNRFPENSFS